MNTKHFCVVIIILLSMAGAFGKQFSFKRQIIKKVEVEGNRYFPDNRLKSRLLTKPNRWNNFFSKRRLSRANLGFDEKQLEGFYGRNGFLFSRVEAVADYYREDSSKAVVVFNISEGKRVILNSVGVSGGLPEINAGLARFTSKLKPGKPVNADAVLATGFNIRDYYSDKGYPLASVRPSFVFLNDSLLADINFEIAESSFVLNGDITIVQDNYTGTAENVIRRELLVEKGQPYNRSLNMESQNRLYSTGLVKFVSFKRSGDLNYIIDDTASTDFRLLVTGKRPNFVNVRAGIGQDPDFNSVFQTSISWGNQNLWGTGRKLILQASNSLQLAKKGQEERALKLKDLFSNLHFTPVKNSIGLNYVEPWFLNYRMPLSVSGTYEPGNKNRIIDKYYDSFSGEASLLREMNKFTSARFSVSVQFVNIRDVAPADQAVFRAEGDNSIRRRLQLYGQRDTRDNLFVPQKGSYSYISLEYVGHLLGGDFSFARGEFYWSRYKILLGQNILASRFRIGMLDELGDNGRSSATDRFTLGGAKTVRGFAENELGPKWTAADSVSASLIGRPKGGRLLLLGNLELRRPLFWRFGGSAFVDAGNAFYNFSDFQWRRIAATTGLGLQFFTPVGPIRLDYAFLLQKKLDLGEGSYHLTILYAF